MHRIIESLPGLVLGVLCASAPAQNPSKPPPWWGVSDEVTVSLYWDFNTAFPPGQPTLAPTFAEVPPWFDTPVAVTAWTASNNIEWIPALAGHVGVCGLVGNGTPQQASLGLRVDNDPHLDWVKVFWFQFDQFEGASGEVSKSIAEQLNKYGRAIVSERSEPLGSGWQRVTIDAQLIPQPDDEDLDWSFVENAFGTVAIDDLYVSSRCIKPKPDERGAELGKVVSQTINLTAQTNRTCRAVARTAGPSINPLPRYWVSALAPTSTTTHTVFQMNDAGVVVGSPVNVPSTGLQAPLGITDLCVETVRNTTGGIVQEFVYGVLDQRSSGGAVEIHAFDAHNNGGPVPGFPLLLTAFPAVPADRFGIAFDPSGNLGDGTFWITAPSLITPNGSRAYEFDRTGAPRDTMDVPPGTSGIAYDDALGKFYVFSADPQPTPSGPIQVNGAEISGYDGEPTGVRFCGDLSLPNPGGSRGGVALGIDAYRTPDTTGTGSELRLLCTVDAGGQQFAYELGAPFGYGYSRYGRCGMQNGPPFIGGAFDVTLTGVPHSLFAVLFLGTSDLAIPIGGPPTESFASILPSVNSQLLLPVAPGAFALTIAVPPTPTLGYASAYFQWIVLDTTAPGLVGFTQAGKTVLYP